MNLNSDTFSETRPMHEAPHADALMIKPTVHTDMHSGEYILQYSKLLAISEIVLLLETTGIEHFRSY